MVVTKIWLIDKMKESVKELEDQEDPQKIAFSLGKKEAYQNCFNELTKPPTKKITNKKIDPDKGYESIVKYYMDKKGYTKEHANEIAMKSIKDQKQRVL